MALTQSRRNIGHCLLRLIAALTIVLGLSIAGSPAVAHQNHDKKKAPAGQLEQRTATAVSAANPASARGVTKPMPHAMPATMDMEADRSRLPFLERFVQWLGRLHPFLVHFPIAFFPAALFTAIVGRRRPAFSAPVQFLVIAGGLVAPFAAAAGWVAGLSTDPEPILTYHRWLGVAIGIGGAGLGTWAWRRPWEDRGAGMILALSIMTLAIAVQGFLGAAVTHGMEHLMF